MIKELKICANWVYGKLKIITYTSLFLLALLSVFIGKYKYDYYQCINSGLQSYDCDFD